VKWRHSLCVVTACLLLAAVAHTDPPLGCGRSGALDFYLRALARKDYVCAYRRLTQSERAYFGNAANLASVFESDRYRLQHYTLGASIGNDRRCIVLVRERFSLRDYAHDRVVTLEGTIPYGVVRTAGRYSVKDAGHPRKAIPTDVSSKERGAAVAVRKISFFPKYVQLVLTFTNMGDGFLTVMPYRKSVLKDDAGVVYRIMEAKDWRITDKQLFLGLRIASNAQYTGFINFQLPPGSLADRLHLEIAPLVRERDALPFSISLPPIDVSRT